MEGTDYLEKYSFSTPYYKTLVLTPKGIVSRTSNINYTPYQVYVLKGRLLDFLNKHYGSTVDIIPMSIRDGFKMRLNFYVSDGSKTFKIEAKIFKEIEQLIEFVTGSEPLLALAYKPKNRYEKLILPFTKLDPRLKPVYKNGKVYVQADEVQNYVEVINQLNVDLVTLLEDYYRRGVIFLTNDNLLDKWELDRLNDTSAKPWVSSPGFTRDTSPTRLFYPDWTDKRVTNYYYDMVGFLNSRIKGEKKIFLYLGGNSVRRHYLSLELNTFLSRSDLLAKQPTNQRFVRKDITYYFSNDYLVAEVDNLEQAQNLATVVDKVKNISFGKVLTFKFSSTNPIQSYVKASNDLNLITAKNDSVNYVVDEPAKPHVLSILYRGKENHLQMKSKIRLKASSSLSKN